MNLSGWKREVWHSVWTSVVFAVIFTTVSHLAHRYLGW